MDKPKEQIGLVAISQRDGSVIFIPPAQARRLAIRILLLADEAEAEGFPQPLLDGNA